MCPVLHTHEGFTEAVIDEDGGLKRFYEVANLLSDELRISFNNKLDDFDSLIWDFTYHGQALSLHYNIYTGICLYPQQSNRVMPPQNKAVADLAGFLESRLLINTVKKYIS
ncbi:hypothetical protein [Flavihumibacter sp. CACIAM 22H1]|uniref:hypothetical protein n=1 Tax=Flavihumibacter sp. CACIAM 22H1 TaxID=1812911 RepID=UPI0007A80861|nr:hypothetical protein [Flavihumibacter sp. CACIAM 22H1]KYP15523.1 MAG: hypothetical protein A1D16_21395 [Flavihumibacter sp. CACIAM 22H1]